MRSWRRIGAVHAKGGADPATSCKGLPAVPDADTHTMAKQFAN
jgi:hypothetical protein